MFKKANTAIALLIIGLAACNSSGSSTKDHNKESDIYYVPNADTGMNAAIEHARNTLPQFDSALKQGNPEIYFSLKKHYKTDDNNGEHIWIGNIQYKNGKYTGTVENVPEAISGLKLGDTAEVATADISDWMYVYQNKLSGGFTMRVIRDRMNEEERKQFDKEIGLIF